LKRKQFNHHANKIHQGTASVKTFFQEFQLFFPWTGFHLPKVVVNWYNDKLQEIVFYAYTKSISYWVNQLGNIPSNFKLNASYGGKQDSLIEQYNLKSVKVVYTVEQAGNLVIDHDDTSAFMQDKSFALLLHGVQPKGSDASKALSVLKKQGIHGYGKKKDVRELAVG